MDILFPAASKLSFLISLGIYFIYFQISLQQQLRIEDPCKENVPHLSVAGLYLTEDILLSTPLILLKMSAVQLLDNNIFIRRQREQSKR